MMGVKKLLGCNKIFKGVKKGNGQKKGSSHD